MKSLQTLIKLQKSYVDEQRQLLATLQDQLDKILADIESLEEEKTQQAQLLVDDPNWGLTYGEYLKEARARMTTFLKKKMTAEKAIEIALDKLAELFEEQKRYELAEEKRIEEEKKEEAHKERLFLDEVGSVSYERRHRKTG